MKCPVCNITLNMMDRQGVEIDYCPQCRGVWLDRGELDKIIERSASMSYAPRDAVPAQESYPPRNVETRGEYYESPGYRDYDQGQRGNYPPYSEEKKRKRGSFLEELFDFD
jgi:Zn-finger nucleic acid-binding protein